MTNISSKIEAPLMKTITLKYDDGVHEKVLIFTSHRIRRSSIYILYRQLNQHRWMRSRT
jgi:hypothetical protein